MKKITSQQQRVLDCIQIYLNKTGFPPTRADICRELGFKSPNSAETHLRALEKKGFISIESGRSRGISIINNDNKFTQVDNEYPVIGLVAAGSPTLAEENIEQTISCPNKFLDSELDYFLKVNSNLKWKNKIYYDSSLNKFEYKRKEGLLLHELLSQINSIDEIDFVIKNHENLKILNDFNVRTLKSKIFKIFNHKKLKLSLIHI